MANFYLNEYDTANSGLYVEGVQGWADGVGYGDLLVELPGRAGQLIAGQRPKMAPRLVSVVGVVKGSTMADLQTKLQDLRGRAAEGVVALSFGDDTDREMLGRLQQFQVAPNNESPAFVIPERKVGMQFLCPNPFLQHRQATLVALPGTGSDAICPLGTAPSSPVITVVGPGASLTITLSNGAGQSLATLVFAFSPSLGSTDYIEIDTEAMTIIKGASGTRSNAYSSLTSGTFFALDPHDGAVRLSLSAGSGFATYRRQWF